jgi:hypothetical protein
LKGNLKGVLGLSSLAIYKDMFNYGGPGAASHVMKIGLPDLDNFDQKLPESVI